MKKRISKNICKEERSINLYVTQTSYRSIEFFELTYQKFANAVQGEGGDKRRRIGIHVVGEFSWSCAIFFFTLFVFTITQKQPNLRRNISDHDTHVGHWIPYARLCSLCRQTNSSVASCDQPRPPHTALQHATRSNLFSTV